MNFVYWLLGETYNVGTLRTEILFAVCVVGLLGHIELKVRTIALRALEAAALLVFASIVDVALNVVGISGYPGPTLPALFVALAVYAVAQQRLSFVDRVVRVFTFFSIFTILVSMTGTITSTFVELQSSDLGYDIPSIFSYVGMAVAVIFVRACSIERFDYVSRGFVGLLVGVDVLGAAAAQVFLNFRQQYELLATDGEVVVEAGTVLQAISAVNLFIDDVFILLVFACCYLFYVFSREHDQRAQDLVTRKSDVDNASIAATTKAMYDKLREMRHEIKNHDAYLVSLLDAGDYDRLREVLLKQVDERAQALNRVATGNQTVDAIVNAKMAVASAEGIRMKTMLAVPSELPFDDDDLFRLLANLLDNAIEGTRAAGGSEITLAIIPEGGYWFVSTKNPCDPAKVHLRLDGTLRTSKADAELHGYGTRVIKAVSEKYDGTATFSVAKDVFVASVMLSAEALDKAA